MKKLVILFAMLLLLVAFASATVTDDLNRRLIFAWHPFNATHDNSTNMLEGIETGFVLNETLCPAETPRCFASDDLGQANHIEFVPSGSALDIATPKKDKNMTLTACVNVANLGAGVFSGLVGANNGDTANDGLEIFWTDPDGAGSDINVDIGFNTEGEVFTVAVNDWEENVQSFLMVEWDADKAQLNVSQNLTTFGVDTGAAAGAGTPTLVLPIGKLDANMARDFEGIFWGLYVFNDTLTKDEKEHLFNNGSCRILSTPSAAPPPSDTTPPTIIVDSPLNNTEVDDIPLNFVLNVTDDSNFTMDCTLRNATDIFDQDTFPQNTFSNLTFTSVDNQTQVLNFNVTCFDNSANNNSATQLLTITVDTLNPIITVTLPVNESVFGSDITVELSCFDALISELNYTLRNLSDIDIQTFQNTTDPVNGVLTIDDVIDTSVLGSDVYNMDITCVNGVNTDTELLEFTLDLTVPIIDSTAQSDDNFTETETVQLNVTCSDDRLETIEAFNNESGTFASIGTLTFSPTVTTGTFIFNDTVVLGVTGTLFECSDSLGNSANSSILTYTGNAIIPETPSARIDRFVVILLSAGVSMFLIFGLIVDGLKGSRVSGFFRRMK